VLTQSDTLQLACSRTVASNKRLAKIQSFRTILVKLFLRLTSIHSLLYSFRSVTRSLRRPSLLASAHSHAAAFVVNDALVANQWQHRAWTAPIHQGPARGWIGRRYRYSCLQYDSSGNQTQFTSLAQLDRSGHKVIQYSKGNAAISYKLLTEEIVWLLLKHAVISVQSCVADKTVSVNSWKLESFVSTSKIPLNEQPETNPSKLWSSRSFSSNAPRSRIKSKSMNDSRHSKTC